MKYIPVCLSLLIAVLLVSCEQNQTGSSQTKARSGAGGSITFPKDTGESPEQMAEIAKEKASGAIYRSSSPNHNVVHAFTYLVAVRGFCSRALLQMAADPKTDPKLSERLEWERANAVTQLRSKKYDGLKIEEGLYEKFLKQISDRFRE